MEFNKSMHNVGSIGGFVGDSAHWASNFAGLTVRFAKKRGGSAVSCCLAPDDNDYHLVPIIYKNRDSQDETLWASREM